MSVDGRVSTTTTSNMPPNINRAPHHVRGEICATRPPYREGRIPTAVKVVTVSQESRYVLIQGVPALGTAHDLVKLFATFGKIEEYRILDDYPTEEFQDVYWIRYSRIQSARFAKHKLDDHSFFGGVLHVCYAPEYESVEETREKLQDRRRVIAAKTSGKDSHTLEQQQFVSGGVIDSTQSNNRDELHDIVTKPGSSLNTATQSISQDRVPSFQDLAGRIDTYSSPISDSYRTGIGETLGSVPNHEDSILRADIHRSSFANYMPPSETQITIPGVLYTGQQMHIGAIQHQNYRFQTEMLPWQHFGNLYSMPPPIDMIDMPAVPNVTTTCQASPVTTTGVVQGVEGNAMKEWASVYSLPAPPRHISPKGAPRPLQQHPVVVKGGPRYDHARVPSSHATLPSGYDARLPEKNKLHEQENVKVSEESSFIEKQTLNVQSSLDDYKPSSANQRLAENPSYRKSQSQVTVARTRTQNECQINELLSLKSNSRTGEIIIREYKKPGAPPMFVPRQLKKKPLSEDELITSTGQDSDRLIKQDALSVELRKNALVLHEEHGPSLPDGLIVRKVAASDPVATTTKGIRKRIQQFSDRAPADCKAKKES